MSLVLDRVTCAYGAITTVWEASLELKQGEMVALLGKNGAGKSTLLRAISGVLPFKGGTASFNGKDITKSSANERVSLGINLVPEGRRIFQKMTVRENLRIGSYSSRASVGEKEDLVVSMFPVLKERVNQAAGTLSGGEQQMLAIGRAMMGGPKLLMLDEPSSGLGPIVVEKVLSSLKNLNAKGVTILLAEQNFFLAAKYAPRAYIMDNGKISREGKTTDLLEDEDVKKEYLGLKGIH